MCKRTAINQSVRCTLSLLFSVPDVKDNVEHLQFPRLFTVCAMAINDTVLCCTTEANYLGTSATRLVGEMTLCMTQSLGVFS